MYSMVPWLFVNLDLYVDNYQGGFIKQLRKKKEI